LFQVYQKGQLLRVGVSSNPFKVTLVPFNVRIIVALNLHSYGSGRNPWGSFYEKTLFFFFQRDFVEDVANGLLKIF
ncbi:hypothetical protein S83_063715, partial [Arachis hypogaea]